MYAAPIGVGLRDWPGRGSGLTEFIHLSVKQQHTSILQGRQNFELPLHVPQNTLSYVAFALGITMYMLLVIYLIVTPERWRALHAEVARRCVPPVPWQILTKQHTLAGRVSSEEVGGEWTYCFAMLH